MLWACLLPERVVGVWCLRYWCVRLLVFALLVLARLLGVVGQCGPAAPCPCSAWLVGAHALVWAALTCARFCVPDGRRAAMLGRDMIVPPHAAWRWAAFGRPVARRERERCGVWGALMVC